MIRVPPVPEDLRRAIAARPLLALAAALVAGIVVADCWSPRPGLLLLPALAGLVAAAGARSGFAARGGLLLATAALGAISHALAIAPPAGDVSRLSGVRDTILEGRLIGRPLRSKTTTTFVCEVSRVWTPAGVRHVVCGRAMVHTVQVSGEAPVGAVVWLQRAAIARPREVRNWGEVDRRRLLARQGIHTVIRCERADFGRGSNAAGARLTTRLARVREAMLANLERHMPGPRPHQSAVLLAGMVVGERGERVSDTVRKSFRQCGTIHLLVVSGAQVTMLVTFVLTLLRKRRRLEWWHVVVVAPVLVVFGLVAGLGASIARALIMAGVWMVSLVSDRRYDIASAIALAAIALALTDSAIVFDVGAQLTFAATIGVSVGAWRRRGGAGPHPYLGALARATTASLGAWLAVTPLLAHYFHSFALLGSLANLVAVPLASGVVVVGLAAMLLGTVSGALCTAMCFVARQLIGAILAANHLCAGLPGAFIDPVSMSGVTCLGWLLLVSAGAYLVRSGRMRDLLRRPEVVTGAVVLVAVLIGAAAVRSAWPRPARIVTFDVGEGQCSLLETAEHQTVMVDAGGRRGLSDRELANEVLLPYLLQHGFRRLDVLVITHPDSDHYGAALRLAQQFPIRLAITNGTAGEAGYHALLAQLAQTGTRILAAHCGTRIVTGTTALRFLWPPAGAPTAGTVVDNDMSLVVRAVCPQITALFPGDLEVAGMRQLLGAADPRELVADFLQIPHHGRTSAALPAFFAAVHPRVAVASRAGERQRRGGEAACRVQCEQVFATEECGAVAVESRNGRLWVRTYLGEQQRPTSP